MRDNQIIVIRATQNKDGTNLRLNVEAHFLRYKVTNLKIPGKWKGVQEWFPLDKVEKRQKFTEKLVEKLIALKRR